MNILLAAIIFTFFAVFAPNSHGDRPLLHADPSKDSIQYLDFKLPIARLRSTTTVEQTVSPIPLKHSFFAILSYSIEPSEVNLFQRITFKDQIITVNTSPFVFCEILQV